MPRDRRSLTTPVLSRYALWCLGHDLFGLHLVVFADLGVYLPESPGAQYAYRTPSGRQRPGASTRLGYEHLHVGITTG